MGRGWGIKKKEKEKKEKERKNRLESRMKRKPRKGRHGQNGYLSIRLRESSLACRGGLPRKTPPKPGCLNLDGERGLSRGVLGSTWRASWGRLGLLGRSWERIHDRKNHQKA